jgi:hypothetical protein
MRWTARAHIVFGVDFDEADRLLAGQDLVEMLRLEAYSRAGGKRCRHHPGLPSRAGGGEARVVRASRAGHDLIGASAPVPFGVFIVVQVPFGTYFQALP